MSDIVTPTTHELTYKGLVDPPVDSIMGPGLDGRTWKVLGSIYDTKTRTTAVTVEETS